MHPPAGMTAAVKFEFRPRFAPARPHADGHERTAGEPRFSVSSQANTKQFVDITPPIDHGRRPRPLHRKGGALEGRSGDCMAAL
jgi:hypothetical protein